MLRVVKTKVIDWGLTSLRETTKMAAKLGETLHETCNRVRGFARQGKWRKMTRMILDDAHQRWLNMTVRNDIDAGAKEDDSGLVSQSTNSYIKQGKSMREM